MCVNEERECRAEGKRTPIRILVDHGGYEFRNMGDVGMLQAAVARLQELWPGAKFFIFARETERLQEYCPGAVPVSVNGREIWLQERNLFGALYRMIPGSLARRLAHYEADVRVQHADWAAHRIDRRLSRRGVDITPMREFLDAVRGVDMLVTVGGTYLTDTFVWQADRVLETVRLAGALGKPVGMFGQGIGPLTEPLLRHKLREAAGIAKVLALREERRSKEVLTSIGVSVDHLPVTGDDTIEMVYREKAADLGSGFGVNMRFARYSGVSLKEVAEVRRVIAYFSRRVEAPVYGIPISRHAGDSDVATAEMLLRSIPTARDCGAELDTPLAVIRRLSECRLMLTGAYHGAVYALAQGIPVVALVKSSYYRNKFEGLRDQYGEGCQVLNFDQPDFLASLESALNQQWEAAPRLRNRLLSVAEEQIKRGREAYRQFQILTGYCPSLEAA
ncbi:MAG TPA: polysaccharide pyruvyl transferase family protein [Candidatus Hydrogenedentes bacterium]|nr:polysaccharide pyruvyl transferase family protein [Candidatus Hydrogenedentota bacterium]HOL77844.1 polysaccharide pyruvyl transferase family protein [Candidatus Hydrogenedentota bacterium]HPO86189.1 polysaccharide pyruvyl transferase family protein [Candidatus Hydrogenedentota bacterium]